jgi:hypothetical protein
VQNVITPTSCIQVQSLWISVSTEKFYHIPPPWFLDEITPRKQTYKTKLYFNFLSSSSFIRILRPKLINKIDSSLTQPVVPLLTQPHVQLLQEFANPCWVRVDSHRHRRKK